MRNNARKDETPSTTFEGHTGIHHEVAAGVGMAPSLCANASAPNVMGTVSVSGISAPSHNTGGEEADGTPAETSGTLSDTPVPPPNGTLVLSPNGAHAETLGTESPNGTVVLSPYGEQTETLGTVPISNTPVPSPNFGGVPSSRTPPEEREDGTHQAETSPNSKGDKTVLGVVTTTKKGRHPRHLCNLDENDKRLKENLKVLT